MRARSLHAKLNRLAGRLSQLAPEDDQGLSNGDTPLVEFLQKAAEMDPSDIDFPQSSVAITVAHAVFNDDRRATETLVEAMDDPERSETTKSFVGWLLDPELKSIKEVTNNEPRS